MRTNMPDGYLSPLDSPIPITVTPGERVVKHKGIFIFVDRAYRENGMVYAPVAGSLSYRGGLASGQVSGVIESIGSWFSNTWSWITGSGYSADTWGTIITNDGKEYAVNPSSADVIAQSDGSYWYNTGSELLPVKINPAYAAPATSSGSYLTNSSLNLPGYNQQFTSPTSPASNPSSNPATGGQSWWDSVWAGVSNIPVSYNTNTGLTVGTPAPQPGAVTTTTPGNTNVYSQLGEKALDAATMVLPWAIGLLAAAIVLPPVVGALSKRTA